MEYYNIPSNDHLNYYLTTLNIEFQNKEINHITENEIFKLDKDFIHRDRVLLNGKELDFINYNIKDNIMFFHVKIIYYNFMKNLINSAILVIFYYY